MADRNNTEESSENTIRAFYALVIVLIGIGIGYFVYSTTVAEDSTHPFKLGLDLAGGSHLVYEADVSKIDPNEVPDLMNVLRDVIDRRVNIFGVSEPIVQVESSSFVSENKIERLVVELPGVTDVSTAIEEIGKTPLLEFKLIDESSASNTDSVGSTTAVSPTVFIDTELTGRYLESAKLEFTGQSSRQGVPSEPIVSIRFNEEGGKIFEEITSEHVGESLAIFLDGELLSAPRINEAISGGSAVISGGFDPVQARDLAQNLNFGALPVPITLQSTQTVGDHLAWVYLRKVFQQELSELYWLLDL